MSDDLPEAVWVGGRRYAVVLRSGPDRRFPPTAILVDHDRRVVRVAACKLAPPERLPALRAALAAANPPAAPIIGSVD